MGKNFFISLRGDLKKKKTENGIMFSKTSKQERHDDVMFSSPPPLFLIQRPASLFTVNLLILNDDRRIIIIYGAGAEPCLQRGYVKIRRWLLTYCRDSPPGDGRGGILIEQTTSDPLPPRRDENRINKTTLTRRRRCITSSVCQQQTARNA